MCFIIISLFQQGRLSDDDSADTLDELDPPAEKGQSLNRLQANEEQRILPTEKTYTVLPNESRYVLCTAGSLRQLCNSTSVMMWQMQWPHVLNSTLSGSGSGPGQGYCVVFMDKTLKPCSVSLLPGV